MQELFMNRVGVPLDEWLDKEANLKKINGKRIFYILKPNMDVEPDVFKFGIATNFGSDGDGASRRLKSYVDTYGKEGCRAKTRSQTAKAKSKATCWVSGVTLYALWGVNYNSDVDQKNSAPHKVENFVKAELKENIKEVGRGSERTSVNLGKIIELVEKKARTTTDIVTDTSKRRTTRKNTIKKKGFYKKPGWDS